MTVNEYLKRKHALLNTTAYRINGQTLIGSNNTMKIKKNYFLK